MKYIIPVASLIFTSLFYLGSIAVSRAYAFEMAADETKNVMLRDHIKGNL